MSFHAVRDRLRRAREAAQAQQRLADALAKTPVGKLAREISGIAKSRTATKATEERLRRQLDQMSSGANSEAVARTAVARQIEEIERYSKSESGGAWGWLQRTFGPVADTIKSMLRPGGGPAGSRKEIEAAAELLNALGASTEGAKGRRVSVVSEDPRSKAEAERTLRALGFDVQDRKAVSPPTPPEQQSPSPVNRIDPTRGLVRKMIGGMSVYYRPDDPILTGAMIPVSSSNVHSIGFIWNDDQPEKGTLKVRFLDHDANWKKTTKGGATYHYYDVHPRFFWAFQKAASKGKWVWDNLRIRGTVSGHQFRYGLAGLSKSGYVPRQATRIGNEEYFLGRTVEGANGKSYRSELHDRMVRQLTSNQQVQVSRGFAHSGRPSNNGRGNTGRGP